MTAKEVWLVFRAARDWRVLGATVVLAALAAAVLASGGESVIGFVGYYGPPMVAISVMGRTFEYSQRSSVWMMLAQRPGSDVRRAWSILGVGAAVSLALSAILLVGAMVGILRSPDLPPTAFRSHLLSMPLWSVIVACAVAVTCTAARAGTAGIAVGWLIAPLLVAFLKSALGFSDQMENALQFLAPPFDAVLRFPAVLRGELPEEAALRSAQLVSFPFLCFLLLRWRLRVLGRPDQARVE
ncbi:MAG: hypothetical protein KA761_02225 [Gemmatimonadaceae bacterium]|jgi:hypothetical protein|nr:hypothetical protein [Gemmatimonadaceae bacterium]